MKLGGYTTSAVVVSALIMVAGFAISPIWTALGAVALLAFLVFFLLPADRVALYSGASMVALLIAIPVLSISGYGNLKYAVLALIVALTIVTLVRRPRPFLGIGKGLWLYVAYFLLIAMATPRSAEPAAWNLFLGAVVAGLCPALVFAMMSAPERRKATDFVVWAAALEAAYSLVELFAKLKPLWGYASVGRSGDPNLMYNQIDLSLVRSQGTMGHPLPLALLLLVGLSLVIRGNGPRGGISKMFTVVLLFAGCFAAGSRSAMAVAAILILIGMGKSRWKALLAGGFLLFYGALWAYAAGFFESDVFQRFAGSASLSHRTGALEAVPRLLERQDGLETFMGNGYFSAYQLFRAGLLQTGNFFAIDNQFVMTLVEGGIVGVALLALLILVALRRIAVKDRLGMLSIVVFFFSFDVLSWPSGIALFGAFVGLAFSASTERAVEAEKSEPSTHRTRDTRQAIRQKTLTRTPQGSRYSVSRAGTR